MEKLVALLKSRLSYHALSITFISTALSAEAPFAIIGGYDNTGAQPGYIATIAADGTPTTVTGLSDGTTILSIDLNNLGVGVAGGYVPGESPQRMYAGIIENNNFVELADLAPGSTARINNPTG